jgi:hypothetical protein
VHTTNRSIISRIGQIADGVERLFNAKPASRYLPAFLDFGDQLSSANRDDRLIEVYIVCVKLEELKEQLAQTLGIWLPIASESIYIISEA